MNTTKKAFLITILAAGSIFACEERPNDLQNPSAELRATFDAIQAIHELAAKLAKESADRGEAKIALGAKRWSGSNPSRDQTKQGLFLSIEEYPSNLATPWGKVEIYGGGSYQDSTVGKLFNGFRKNMQLKFVKNTCEKGGPYPDDVIKFYKGDLGNPIEINRKELEKYRGTDVPILANYCGCESIYEVESVQGVKLPKAEPLTKWENYRAFDDVKKSWIALTARRIQTLDQESR